MTFIHILLFFGFTFLLVSSVGAYSSNSTGNHTAEPCYLPFPPYLVEYGTRFKHSEDKCVKCECCGNGLYTCKRRYCPEQDCGINKQTAYSSDGCCKECCDECKNATCQTLSCEFQAFKHDDCCPSCGCSYKGIIVPIGPFGHACEQCVCNPDYTVTCNRPACPSQLLQCVNPTFDNPTDCNYICPTDEYTCRRGDYVIPAGMFVKKKFKYCLCNTNHFYPRAFCVNAEETFGEKYATLRYQRCMAKPDIPTLVDIDLV